MNTWERQLGRFKVSGLFFRGLTPRMGVNLFRGMVVLDVQRAFYSDEREYLAMHAQFRPVPLGEVIPLYEATFDAHSATPIWTEVKQ